MKLYTEEQLQVAYDIGHMDGRLNNTDYSITDHFAPITLPTDEDIKKILGSNVHDYYKGAKWMRDNIKQKQLIKEIMKADENDELYNENK